MNSITSHPSPRAEAPRPRAQAHGGEATASHAKTLFLVAAFLSFAASVGLYFGGNETEGIFVGLWVPSILALGNFVVPAQTR
jgi:hypothetical protein